MVNANVGTKAIQICSEKDISSTVNNFALKYNIYSPSKVLKLKRKIKDKY